jgi:lipopolysaccharide biosynthesis regulator YciM
MQWNSAHLLLLLLIPFAIIVWSLITIEARKKREAHISPFTQALTLLLAGEQKKAMDKLLLAIKEDTDNIHAYIIYGDLLRDTGDIKRAIKVHRELTIRQNLKPDIYTEILRSLVKDYHRTGMIKQALACADEILDKFKDDIWTLDRKLEFLEILEDWHKAFEIAKKLQSLTDIPDKEKLGIYKVMEGLQILTEDGKEHDARLRFREAIKFDNDSAVAYLELAKSYVREERWEDAVKTWKEFFQVNGNQAYLAFDQLEKTLFDLGRFAELEHIYRQLINRDPKNSRAVVALASFLFRKGESAEAIRICREGMEAKPESVWIRRNLFRFLAGDNQLEEAIGLGLEVVDMVTSDAEEFICSNCHYIAHEPLFRCPQCKQWRTFKF